MSTRRHFLIALVGLSIASLAEAAAPSGKIAGGKPGAKKAAENKVPGRKPPAKKLAEKKRLLITINKVSQKMTVELDGEREYTWAVSTGARGYDTPSGTFRPFRMEKDHFSKEWDDAPMPHSIFFTAGGHAVHGSFHVKSLGRRASHGCVRLAPANAAKLFALVGKTGMSNTTVVVRGGLFDSGTGFYRARDKNGRKRSLFPWMDRD